VSYFNDVTGTSDFERQSWRDSYNGGRAAGDITGNVNRQLDRERDAFGTTWSGSSSQYSALELAQRGGGGGSVGNPLAGQGGKAGGSGPGAGVVSYGGASPGGAGPGNAAVAQRPGGGSLTLGGPLSTKIKMTATGGYAGIPVLPNPFFSDVENWWEPRYGEPGEWLGGIANIAADGVWAAGRFADWGFNTDTVSNKRRDGQALNDWTKAQLAGPGSLPGIAASVGDWDRNGAARIDQWFVDTFAPKMGANGGGW
jgi:hypothetical protein